ncbi:hypothetical protein HBI04_003500 [Parastagonospora nodorum]|nr:hypothetical protein HBI03_016510 [Parastagonospora nodorum]KAH4283848.1 hypothetical protein HBI04_003500 [Parastagonospora nodorum]KAH6062828.1 hypothetical protein HBI67_146690 [Parastagonospora nodorum]KAH6086940.1 hypothetical protein HBI66_040440 [Parastagonospora nodorum]
MAGKKRTRTGEVKPSNATQQPQTTTETTPPCAQPQSAANKSTATTHSDQNTTLEGKRATGPPNPTPSKSKSKPKQPHTQQPCRKLPKLPPNTTISRRPLLRPSLPTPFSSSASPKVLYITSSTPFVPALKRIRKLLAEIQQRGKQSQRKKHSGLKSGEVEKGIVDGLARKKGGAEGEKVYVKATGRAIPKALGLGVEFQGEEGCVVRVEMGSVRAVDDVEVVGKEGDDGDEEDIPETRIRNVSSVTVSIGLE